MNPLALEQTQLIVTRVGQLVEMLTRKCQIGVSSTSETVQYHCHYLPSANDLWRILVSHFKGHNLNVHSYFPYHCLQRKQSWRWEQLANFTSMVVNLEPPELLIPVMSGFNTNASFSHDIHTSWSVSAHALNTFDSSWLFQLPKSCDFGHGGTTTLSASFREIFGLSEDSALVASARSVLPVSAPSYSGYSSVPHSSSYNCWQYSRCSFLSSSTSQFPIPGILFSYPSLVILFGFFLITFLINHFSRNPSFFRSRFITSCFSEWSSRLTSDSLTP